MLLSGRLSFSCRLLIPAYFYHLLFLFPILLTPLRDTSPCFQNAGRLISEYIAREKSNVLFMLTSC